MKSLREIKGLEEIRTGADEERGNAIIDWLGPKAGREERSSGIGLGQAEGRKMVPPSRWKRFR